MRIKIEVVASKNIYLPKSYNAYIQAFIYTMLNPHAATWLHNSGFELKEKKFRLFTFSEILERAKINDNYFVFPSQISFFVSSPVDWILEQVAHNAIKSPAFKLGNNDVNISSIAIMAPAPIESEKITIKAVTPIEVHTTFDTKENKKKTYFYTPFEDEFSLRVNDNLQNKWSAYSNKICTHSVNIKPLFKGNKNLRVRSFVKKNSRPFRINGWVGKYVLEGHPDFLKFAFDAGLGSGNSRGFGMFQIV
jgi:CRISPR-associated endoribonuclease Cas6